MNVISTFFIILFSDDRFIWIEYEGNLNKKNNEHQTETKENKFESHSNPYAFIVMRTNFDKIAMVLSYKRKREWNRTEIQNFDWNFKNKHTKPIMYNRNGLGYFIREIDRDSFLFVVKTMRELSWAIFVVHNLLINWK